MTDTEDRKIIIAMGRYGSGFEAALADLAVRADADNLALIKATWPGIWDQWAKGVKELEARGEAL